MAEFVEGRCRASVKPQSVTRPIAPPPPPISRHATSDIAELVASNRELAEAIRVQAVAINALADAIAAPMEGEPDAPQADDVERYMDGTPVDA